MSAKKSLKVGDIWEIGVSGSEGSDQNPTVDVEGPFGGRTFVATKTDDGKFVAYVAINQPGDYTASNSDGASVGSATAK